MIELLIVIAIIAILLAAALPSFREFMLRSQTRQISQELMHDLNLARAEAVRLGVPVTVTHSGANWSFGWTVATTDLTLATHLPLAAGFTLTTNVASGQAPASIAYSTAGSLASPTTAVNFSVCRPDGNHALSQIISIKASGSISVSSGCKA